MFKSQYLTYKNKYLELKSLTKKPKYRQIITIKQSVTTLNNIYFPEKHNIPFDVVFATGTMIEALGEGLFARSKIVSITIPRSVQRIDKNCFSFTPKLKTVGFEHMSELAVLGENAFQNSGITSLVLPSSVTDIHKECFLKCFILKSISIPQSVINIGESCFRRCDTLTDITFEPNSQLKTIGSFAFSSSGITSIKIPSSVERIGCDCFNNCRNLKEIIFESNVEFFDSYQDSQRRNNLTKVSFTYDTLSDLDGYLNILRSDLKNNIITIDLINGSNRCRLSKSNCYPYITVSSTANCIKNYRHGNQYSLFDKATTTKFMEMEGIILKPGTKLIADYLNECYAVERMLNNILEIEKQVRTGTETECNMEMKMNEAGYMFINRIKQLYTGGRQI